MAFPQRDIIAANIISLKIEKISNVKIWGEDA